MRRSPTCGSTGSWACHDPGLALNILFLTSRLPGRFQGDRVRAYHQLRILGRRHRITLISFASPAEYARGPGALVELCARVVMVPSSLRQMAAALCVGGCPSFAAAALYESPECGLRWSRRVEDYAPPTSSWCACAVPRRGRSLPHVVDLGCALAEHGWRARLIEDIWHGWPCSKPGLHGRAGVWTRGPGARRIPDRKRSARRRAGRRTSGVDCGIYTRGRTRAGPVTSPVKLATSRTFAAMFSEARPPIVERAIPGVRLQSGLSSTGASDVGRATTRSRSRTRRGRRFASPRAAVGCSDAAQRTTAKCVGEASGTPLLGGRRGQRHRGRHCEHFSSPTTHAFAAHVVRLLRARRWPRSRGARPSPRRGPLHL